MARYAIIGTGISGMTAAHILHKHGHEITIFEKNDYIGGHTHTVYENDGEREIPIDTGFIVFNEVTYPCMLSLFRQLGVEYQDTDMSFAVSDRDNKMEYCGSTLSSLFCDRKNIFSPKFYKLIYEINKFNELAPEVLINPELQKLTIKEFFEAKKLGSLCLKYYLLPMSVALWSAPQKTIEGFPILSLVNFFKNHGLLGFTTQFQWKTVTNGSFQYRDKLIEPFRSQIRTNSKIEQINRTDDSVNILVDGKSLYFDNVVIAAHADQTLSLLGDATELENNLLSVFGYQKNSVCLHTDDKLMPKNKSGWAAWNHYSSGGNAYVTYWMNKLQSLETKTNYFVSLNADEIIEKGSIKQQFIYHHPIFTLETYQAQKRLQEINRQGNNTFFCGSYFGHGFHEDGARSAVEMCKAILNKEEVL